jgi:3-mercaptopyruvate sulfurtransferase SseA
MSPRAASRLEIIGFERVYDYVAGKAAWTSAGLPLEGANGSETRAGTHLRADVPTFDVKPRRRRGQTLARSGPVACGSF